MIRSGAAARQIFMSSGSPLTMPMMLCFSITAMVSRMTASSVVAAGIAFSHGGETLKMKSPCFPASARGMTEKGAHIGGGLDPA